MLKRIYDSPFWQTVIVFTVLAFAPVILITDFLISLAVFVLIYSIVVLSWNLLVGYSEQISFGHNGFFLVGAYTSAILVKTVDLPFIVGFFSAGVLTAIMSILVGFPAVRLKGFYLGMVTIAFAEGLNVLARYFTSLTGGVYGFAGIPKASIGGYIFSSGVSYFYLALVVCFFLFLCAQNLVISRTGYALQALRSDEVVATAMGVNTMVTKLQIFALSAFFTGLAGALYAHFVRFIAPGTFTLKFQVSIFAMSIVGGSLSIWGALIGAAVMTLLPHIVTGLEDLYYVISAIIVILVLAVMPRGIYSLVVALVKKRLANMPKKENI